MKTLRFLLQKEFLQVFRNRTILAMMFAVPNIQLIIIPLAINYEVKDLRVSVVDKDHSSLSQQLINTIGASGYFRYVSAPDAYAKGMEQIEEGRADIVMEIPPGFERNLVREGRQAVSVSADAINSMKASLGMAYLNTIINGFNKNNRLNVFSAPAASRANIEIASSTWFNPEAEYKYYIVPGVLVLLLTMIGGFLSALNIVREKEMGTIEQINVTPVKKWEFILGKLIPFWVMGLAVFTLGLLVSWLIYGVVPQGSLALLYLFAAVYLIAILGFGLLISTYSDNQLQAMFVALFFVMIFTLMSGLFTAVESMPGWAAAISNLIPITHFIKAIRMIVLKGSGFSDVKMELLYTLMFAVVLNGWAIWNYRKTS